MFWPQSQVSTLIECLAKLQVVCCIFSDIFVRKDGTNCLLEWWVFREVLWYLPDGMSLLFGENSSRTSDCLYWVCSSKTPSCIHVSVYSTKQMLFAWVRGLVLPSKPYFYGNEEMGKQNTGKLSWSKGAGCARQICVFGVSYKGILAYWDRQRGKIAELSKVQHHKQKTWFILSLYVDFLHSEFHIFPWGCTLWHICAAFDTEPHLSSRHTPTTQQRHYIR